MDTTTIFLGELGTYAEKKPMEHERYLEWLKTISFMGKRGEEVRRKENDIERSMNLCYPACPSVRPHTGC